MLPACNRSMGMSLGFPDPCMTPVGPAIVLMPYPNAAKHAMAVGFSPSVFFSGSPGLTVASFIPITPLAAAGLDGKQAGRFTAGNPVVKLNALPAISLCSPTTGNNAKNPMGVVVMPPVVSVFLTFAAPGAEAAPGPDPFARELCQGDLAELQRELASAGREGGPPVAHAMLAPGVGGVAIRVFSADVPARVFSAIRALEAEGLRELVLDLRGNPGGEETAFVELASDFLDAGCVVVTRIDANGDETVLRTTRAAAYPWPVTIVVDRGTASAAELFAGCLKAHGRARVVGERTYGKGVGQQVRVTAEGRARAASVVRYRLPDGGEVQGVGVEAQPLG